MQFLEFKAAKDETQETAVSISLDWLTAVIEHDQKKTELLVGDHKVLVWGSHTEVMNKIHNAQV